MSVKLKLPPPLFYNSPAVRNNALWAAAPKVFAGGAANMIDFLASRSQNTLLQLRRL